MGISALRTRCAWNLMLRSPRKASERKHRSPPSTGSTRTSPRSAEIRPASRSSDNPRARAPSARCSGLLLRSGSLQAPSHRATSRASATPAPIQNTSRSSRKSHLPQANLWSKSGAGMVRRRRFSTACGRFRGRYFKTHQTHPGACLFYLLILS